MREDLSDAYANGAYIAGADAYPRRWAALAEAYRTRLGALARLDLPYGEGARERFDLFLPEGAARGLVVFLHGGYWMAFDKASWSHLAEGARAQGWAVAMPSYDHCPEVRIGDITQQVAQAIRVAAGDIDGPIRICGHSAGGHLTARMGAVLPDLSDRIEKLLPISPLSDLFPLRLTGMNATLRIDPQESETESPVHQPMPDAPVHVWVGGDERPAFLDQARWLADAWDCPLTLDEGRHHFDVIDGLSDPESALVRALLS